MKKGLWFIIIACASILCIGLGSAYALATAPGIGSTEIDKEALKAAVKAQFKEDLMIQVENEAVRLQLVIQSGKASKEELAAAQSAMKALGVESVQLLNSAEAKKATLSEIAGEPVPPGAEVTVVDGETVIEIPAEKSAAASSGPQVKDQWIQEKIAANRDNISEEDLAAGASIYNSLDTDLLFGLAAGGLTPEEDAQVQAYLNANLSPGEAEIAKQLYYKYIGLL